MEKHILICGERGVGKSTLIRRLTALYPGPVSALSPSGRPWRTARACSPFTFTPPPVRKPGGSTARRI